MEEEILTLKSLLQVRRAEKIAQTRTVWGARRQKRGRGVRCRREPSKKGIRKQPESDSAKDLWRLAGGTRKNLGWSEWEKGT